ncbi:hypothetical protein Bbelb_222990 [Branchiostoma belcheri]|nr:hypothetical protein Bbelb_222990 [Branchiostoma belcheri]
MAGMAQRKISSFFSSPRAAPASNAVNAVDPQRRSGSSQSDGVVLTTESQPPDRTAGVCVSGGLVLSGESLTLVTVTHWADKVGRGAIANTWRSFFEFGDSCSPNLSIRSVSSADQVAYADSIAE